MDKPICPYCGAEMRWGRNYYSQLMPGTRVSFWWECVECGARSPSCKTEGAALSAAMQRCGEVLRLMEQIDHGNAVLDEYKSEIDRLRAELEAAKEHHAIIAALPNCNDCKDMKSCEKRPGLGEWVRFNCPLWRGLCAENGGESK